LAYLNLITLLTHMMPKVGVRKREAFAALS
jgi:hypothetical protein